MTRRTCILVVLASAALPACTARERLIGAAAVTVVGAATPGNDLDQTYYLGVYDPEEQIPPSLYRVRVRGQASALSQMRFASGWVPAAFVDSLDSKIDFDPATGNVRLGQPSEENAVAAEKRHELAAAAAAQTKAVRAKEVEAAKDKVKTARESGKTAIAAAHDTARASLGRAAFVLAMWKAAPADGQTQQETSDRAARETGLNAAQSAFGDARTCARQASLETGPEKEADVDVARAELAAARSEYDGIVKSAADGGLGVSLDLSGTLTVSEAKVRAQSLVPVAPRIAYLRAVVVRLEAANILSSKALSDERVAAREALDNANGIAAKYMTLRSKIEGTGTTESEKAEVRDALKAVSDATPFAARVATRLDTAKADVAALTAAESDLCFRVADAAAAEKSAAEKDAAEAAKVTDLAATASSARAIAARSSKDSASTFEAGRRLVLFGPEGFRESPANHRLAIVMGSSPQKFFEALGGTLKTVQRIELARADANVLASLNSFRSLLAEEDRLVTASRAVKTALDSDAAPPAAPSSAPAAPPAGAAPASGTQPAAGAGAAGAPAATTPAQPAAAAPAAASTTTTTTTTTTTPPKEPAK